MLQPSPVAPHQAQAELVTQPLYDSDTIANGAVSITWFDGTNTANLLLSNMEQAGVLSHPKFFRVGGVRLSILNAQDAVATALTDHLNIDNGMFFVFTIGQLKPYLQVPFFFIPAGCGMSIRTGALAGWQATKGESLFHNFMRLKHHISIPPLQSFRASGTAPTALVLTTTQTCYVFLDGEFGREVI